MSSSFEGVDDEAVAADLPEPTEQPILSTSQLAGPRLKPSQVITVYSPDEWEELILEWANCLKSEYHRVKRYAGPGDRGRDVVGLVTPDGLRGEWDCFQCKHYKHALRPSDAYPEIAKIILGVAQGIFALPRRYLFVAPKGAGPKLEHLFSDCEQLSRAFTEALGASSALVHLSEHEVATITNVLDDIDFSVFDTVQMDDVIEAHRKSPYHLSRFGGQLGPRPPSPDPPADPISAESKYIAKLLKVYRERCGNSDMSLSDVANQEWYRDDLARQRQSFFSAEALRTFARDKVPPNTFESLQTEIYDGVVEIAQHQHPNGYERLVSVLTTACKIQLNENALITVSRQSDKKGICHQLANDDRLNWVDDSA